MKHEPVLGLAPMLEALGVEQTVSFDDCYALLGELFDVTRRSPKVGELSGNEWCALVNLAMARHKKPNAELTGLGRSPAESAEEGTPAKVRLSDS